MSENGRDVTEQKREVVKNLYLSGIGEEFIALQLDLELPMVIVILKEFDIYRQSASA